MPANGGRTGLTSIRHIFLFTVGGRRYALDLAVVERVVHAVAVTPLSDGPGTVLGVISLHGKVVPVVDLRRRLGLPGREILPEDHLVVARTAYRTVAFFADSVQGVVEEPEGAVAEGNEVAPGLDYVRGVVRLPGGLALIHDLDRVLSIEDHRRLDEALEGTAAHG
jgi:purine-binding chemotaxis protein CheW